MSISSVMPTPRVCSVTFRLHDNKGTTFVSLYRMSRLQMPPTFFEKVHFSSMIHFDSRMHNLKSEKNQENEKTSFDRRLFSYFTASASCYKCRCQSNSLFLGFAHPVAGKCSVGLHGALFTFSLKLRKKSPMKNTVNKPPF